MKKASATKRSKRPIQVGDVTYESITAFCDAYGLKYPAVSAHLRKGRSPEEILDILEALPTTTRYKEDSEAAIPCSYGGVDYPSITAAADALGIPSHRIYSYRKTHKCSASNAIQHLMEDDQQNTTADIPGRAQSCCIAGVLYPSKGAACKAYGTRYITVQSRMKREGLTFEEALTSGGIKRKHILPVPELWHTLNLQPISPADEKSAFAQVLDTLSKAGITPLSLYDMTNRIGAIKFTFPLRTLDEERTMYFLLPYPLQSIMVNIEFIIPELYLPNSCSQNDAQLLLKRINMANHKYAGVSLSLIDGHVQATSLTTQINGHINSRLLLRWFHQSVGTAASMLDVCKDDAPE